MCIDYNNILYWWPPQLGDLLAAAEAFVKIFVQEKNSHNS